MNDKSIIELAIAKYHDLSVSLATSYMYLSLPSATTNKW